MKTEDIVEAAEERLAEIESEAVKLRAIIAAAKGSSIAPFVPVPMPIHPTSPFWPWSPNAPWHLEGPTCGLLTTWVIDPQGTQIVVGGPRRMDPNVRFANGSSDGGYASLEAYLADGGKWD